MKIWLVSEGERETYHIVAAFSSYEFAKKFADDNNKPEDERYDVTRAFKIDEYIGAKEQFSFEAAVPLEGKDIGVVRKKFSYTNYQKPDETGRIFYETFWGIKYAVGLSFINQEHANHMAVLGYERFKNNETD